MDKKAILTDYIKEKIMRNRNARLDMDEDLLTTGILDSLSIFSLVIFLETSFGIEVPETDVTNENFRTINAILCYLERFS